MTTNESKPAVSEETIRRALGEFQITVGDQQVLCIQKYIRILLQWNEKLNLTAIRDPLEMLHRHFCESMYAGVAISGDFGRLADIGSGAGFPGIPLKILRPEIELFLVESNIKKGTFLAEVVRELELTNARVLISRYEELSEELAPLDYVCSRAVGEFGPFLDWAASERLSARRTLLWIGGRDLGEVKNSTLWEWQEPIAVPQSLRRYLLAGSKKQ
ncbi:MAG TPA: 16S rRNA (guanine(527)-N(7))-methyltransferase RsmG [Candidatus Acidoferrales bacterium]|jgi:16S rRNA (guanine527-N7)-methyltransferase|nr:16S rRNA (guanine(527)-N(7))-methyltransferase RsmG [Candidatus Acidoferrales bacterium]